MKTSSALCLLAAAAWAPTASATHVYMLNAGQCGQSELENRLVAFAAMRIVHGL